MARYSASLACVSEIPKDSLRHLNQKGLSLLEGSLGYWNPKWTEEIPLETMDWEFSERRHFRFMQVLSIFVESENDGRIVTSGFLPIGSNGEQTAVGRGVLGIGTLEGSHQGDTMTINVDSRDVAIFEQSYGAQTAAINLHGILGGDKTLTLTQEVFFPPIWSRLRVGMAADGSCYKEVCDYSYFPRHFIFDQGVFLLQTEEDITSWERFGWGPIDEWAEQVMFDEYAAEEWWGKGGEPVRVIKGSRRGNPWRKTGGLMM